MATYIEGRPWFGWRAFIFYDDLKKYVREGNETAKKIMEKLKKYNVIENYIKKYGVEEYEIMIELYIA